MPRMYVLFSTARHCLLLGLLSRALICGATPELENMVQKSQQLFAEKRYREAADLLQQARTKAGAQHDEFSEAVILNRLGLALEHEGQYVNAHQAFDESIARVSHSKGPNSPELVAPMNNLANLLYESDEPSQAEGVVRRSLGVLAANGPPDARTGTELAILAKMQLTQNKMEVAGQSAEESIRIFQETSHSQDPVAALGYSVMGVIYDARRDVPRAEEALKTAVSILQKSLGPYDYVVGEGMANLGLLYAHEGSPDKALPLFEQAHANFRASSSNTTFIRRFLETWADMEQKMNHKHKAEELKKEAKALASISSETSLSHNTLDANAFR